MTAHLIERLPDEGDPQRPIEERVAQELPATSVIGWWWCKMDSK